ncbi:MAG: hypothetical protein ABI574_00320 [Burkholderiales bacterium]
MVDLFVQAATKTNRLGADTQTIYQIQHGKWVPLTDLVPVR